MTVTREKSLLFTVRISDCDVQTFRVSGAGGQHRDKTSNGVRIIHRPSGAVGKSGEERSQLRNKKKAFRRMGESVQFQTWAQNLARGIRPIDEVIDEMIADENLKIESC